MLLPAPKEKVAFGAASADELPVLPNKDPPPAGAAAAEDPNENVAFGASLSALDPDPKANPEPLDVAPNREAPADEPLVPLDPEDPFDMFVKKSKAPAVAVGAVGAGTPKPLKVEKIPGVSCV